MSFANKKLWYRCQSGSVSSREEDHLSEPGSQPLQAIVSNVVSSVPVSFTKLDLLNLAEGSCLSLALIRWPVLCCAFT